MKSKQTVELNATMENIFSFIRSIELDRQNHCKSYGNYSDEIWTCSKLRNLKNFTTRFDGLRELPDILIGLESLYIGGDIKKLPNTFTNLKKLDCSHSSLRSIPETFTKLKSLNANHSGVSKIPGKFTELETIIIYNTNLNSIPDTLINLKMLNISSTYVSSISEKFTALEILYASDSRLTNIPRTLVNLKTLDISYCFNYITNIPNTLVKLQSLDIYGCSIKTLPDTFKNLRELGCKCTSSISLECSCDKKTYKCLYCQMFSRKKIERARHYHEHVRFKNVTEIEEININVLENICMYLSES